ncbi:MAG: MFS transporter [Oligoflexia bacterium]|nr:MFS transporter [Oligoflexia bacterium]
MKGLGRDFWLFRAGQFVSVIGDGCANIAIAWWILDKTGSAAAMSAILAPAMVARVFLLPLFGPLGDRFERRRLVLLSDLWRGALFLALAAMALSGSFQLFGVVALYILTAVGTALFNSVSSSIVPQLVAKEQIPRAMRQTQAVNSVGSILGGMVGGVLVSFLGVGGALLVNCVSFFLAAAASAVIRSQAASAPSSQRRGAPLRQWAEELKSGFVFLFRVRVLFWTCIVAMALNFLANPMAVALPVFVKEARGMPAYYLGLLESAFGAGVTLGALAVGKIHARIPGDRLILGGVALMGLGLAGMPWLPTLVAPALLMALAGLGNSLANVHMNSQLMLATPDLYRSRVYSSLAFLASGMAPLGVLLAGSLIPHVGVGWVMSLCGAGILLLLPLFTVIPNFTHFLRMPQAEAETFFKRSYPRAFEGSGA